MTTGYSVQPNKAVVGASAFAHESGIHQHGVLSNRATYEIMDPLEIGLEGNRLVLGKHSGPARVRRRARQDRASRSTTERSNRAFARFKDLADRKIQITDQDLEAIVGRGARRGRRGRSRPRIARRSAAARTCTPSATVRLRRGEETIEESAIGDGMIDAAMRRDRARGRRGGATRELPRVVGDRAAPTRSATSSCSSTSTGGG